MSASKAIDQGEVVRLTVVFDAAPPEPVRLWVVPTGQDREGPFTMVQAGQDRQGRWVYRYDYFVEHPGFHLYGVESGPPVSAAEGSFTAAAKRARP